METIDNYRETMSTGATRTVEAPELVRRGLARCAAEQRRCHIELELTHRTGALLRMAELYRREARWWGALASWVYSDRSEMLAEVFGQAVIAAQVRAEDFGDRYERMAESAAARLAGGDRR